MLDQRELTLQEVLSEANIRWELSTLFRPFPQAHFFHYLLICSCPQSGAPAHTPPLPISGTVIEEKKKERKYQIKGNFCAAEGK